MQFDNYADRYVVPFLPDLSFQSITLTDSSITKSSYFAINGGRNHTFAFRGVADSFIVTIGDDGANAADVPEPASLALLGLGLTGLALSRRRKAK